MELKFKDIEMKIGKDEAELGVTVLDKVLKLHSQSPTQEVKEVIKEVKVEVPVEKIVEKVVTVTSRGYDLMNKEITNVIEGPYPGFDFGRFILVNCTKHPITIYENGNVTTIGPSGINTRIKVGYDSVNENDCPFVAETKLGVIDAPAMEKNYLFIVSRIVFDAVPERYDFISPNNITARRDEKGDVSAVANFIVHEDYYKVAE